MKRRITLCSGQFGDMPVEQLCRLAHEMGYDGLELAAHSHIDVERIASDEAYCTAFEGMLKRYELCISAISAHAIGQCVGSEPDARLDAYAPKELRGKPEAIRRWAAERMIACAKAAQRLGVKTVTCFMGSPIWRLWYAYPRVTKEMIDEGYAQIREAWTPIFDAYDACGVRLALEVHPAQPAFDYYSTQRLFQEIGWRETLGLNFDPSHLLWQGVDPIVFLRDFGRRVLHVHIKDVRVRRDGRSGILGSHLPFGDTRRSWNFVSPGRGDVDFEGIVRELNQLGYEGPLCVEWEDNGMDRVFGAREALAFVQRLNFEPAQRPFDAAVSLKEKAD